VTDERVARNIAEELSAFGVRIIRANSEP